MAISPGGEGKARRKAVDADLNLVPYIDLLTCMVAFLLITSIWTQLARLEVAQKGQGEVDGIDEKDHLRVAVLVSADSFNLIVKDDQKPIPKRGDTLDYARLADELKSVKLAHPDARCRSSTRTPGGEACGGPGCALPLQCNGIPAARRPHLVRARG